MEMHELASDLRQPHFARCDLVAKCTAECLETSGFLPLLRGSLCIWHLRNQVHCAQHRNTALEAFPNLPSSFRKPELSLLPDSVASVAAVCLEHILREFLLAFASRLHSVKRGGGALGRGLGRR
jgi:hypothetical protein